MAQRIGLVAAPRQQRGTICRARDQYDPSPVFRRARDYCERTYDSLYVLSPTHGLVAAQQVIGPDAAPFTALDAAERQRWARAAAIRLRELCERSAEPPTFYLYAGQRVASLLLRAAPFAEIQRPLSGLRLGAQLRWYNERLAVTPRIPLGGK
jgi:hypothetical protein